MKNNKYSNYKIAFFPEKIQSFKEGRIDAPIYVRVKPINLCDHSCFFCVYSTGFRKHDKENHLISGMHTDIVHEDAISRDKMLEILEDFRDIGVKAVTYSGGGEPLLHRDIVEFMQTTLDYGIDLSIITNGQMLAKQRAEVLSHAKWVRVSMDYTNAQQMASSRGVSEKNFNSIIHNLDSFSKIMNPDCDLAVNYIIHRDNYQGIFEFTRLLKNCGVNIVRFSPVWTQDINAYHAPIYDSVCDELNKISELIDDSFSVNSTYSIHNDAHRSVRGYKKCFFMQTVPVVGADLRVYACHNKAYDKSGAIGSIAKQRFKELWFSDEAKQIFESLNPMEVCRHECANDKKNLFIHELLSTSTDNFV